MAFSGDGRILVTGGSDRLLRFWDLAAVRQAPDAGGVRRPNAAPQVATSLPEVAAPLAHPDPVWCAAFSPDGRFLATGCDDGRLRVWRLAARRPAGRATYGRWLATNRPFVMPPFVPARTAPAALLTGHDSGVLTVAFSPDGGELLTASWDGTARVWSHLAGRSRTADEQPAGARPIAAGWLAFSPGRRLLAVGEEDGVRILRVDRRAAVLRALRQQGVQGGAVPTFPQVARLRRPVKAFDYWPIYSPAGDLLATCATDDRGVTLWQTDTWQPVGQLADKIALSDFRFSPDGRTAAMASFDSTLSLWDVAQRRRRVVLRGHIGRIASMAFSPDGRLLATGAVTDTIRLWDVASGRALGSLGELEVRVHHLAFSPDGRTLAAGLMDHGIQLWDVATRRKIAGLRGHTSHVSSVVWFPDGKTLASADHVGTVKLWNVATRREVATLRAAGKSEVIYNLDVSDDGSMVAAARESGPFLLWFAPSLAEIDAGTGVDPRPWVRNNAATLQGR